MVLVTTQKTSVDGSTMIEFLPSWVTGIFGSGFCLIFLCTMLIIPILELVFGLVFQNQCTIDNRIPIFFIVSGACGIASILIMLIMVLMIVCLFKKHSTGVTFCVICIVVMIVLVTLILSLFLSVWYILGNVWIFQVKSTVNLNGSTSTNYCHPTLYNFAFWILISSYILAFVSCCIPFCIGMCCAGKLFKSES